MIETLNSSLNLGEVRFGTDYSLPKTKNNYKGGNVSPIIVDNSLLMTSASEVTPEAPALSPDIVDNSLVTPLAGFVMKSRRSDGTKVFINVCSHTSIAKGFFAAPVGPVEIQDKDGSLSLVYDICCDAETMTLSQSSKEEQDHLCQFVIETLNSSFILGEAGRLGTDYSLPKTKNNYKGEKITARQLIPLEPDRKQSGSGKMDETVPESVLLGPITSVPPTPTRKQPPYERKGWLKKEGRSFIKNWKNRYFVVQEGVLTYYENSATQPPYGQNERGKCKLAGAKVEQRGSTTIFIRFPSGAEKDLQLQCADARECSEWLQSLHEHIAYLSS